MSKTLKRKITVELPKPRDLSKNRLSVFQRLGTRKLKSLESTSNTDDALQFQANISSLAPTRSNNDKPETVALEDADPDLLEKKRAELQKELELQLKMETARKPIKDGMIRKRKKVPSSSSSSSSSSDSSSTDSSSSSSSKESKRKIKRTKPKRRNSSSSSDEPRLKKPKAKRICHKKTDPAKAHKLTHVKKSITQSTKIRKRSQSPMLRKQRVTGSPSRLSHKQHSKIKVVSDGGVLKHHRLKDPSMRLEKERDPLHPQRDRERERERVRSRDKERGRSRTPKFHAKSRSPKMSSRSRDISHKSSPRRALSPTKSRSLNLARRERTPDRMLQNKKDHKRHDNSRDRERDRREKDRQEREAAREKERAEILARCQERQRERERLARENARRDRDRDDERIGKSDRLIPRPAERAMALATAAHNRSRDKSRDGERPRSHSHGRISGRDRIDRDKEIISYERSFDREDPRYEHVDRRYEKDDRAILDERDRYMTIRRQENSHGHSPYAVRDKRLERNDMEREMYISNNDQLYNNVREDHREPLDYQANTRGYADDRHRLERDREWIRENEIVHEQDRRLIYDHPPERIPPVREWDRNEVTTSRTSSLQHNYGDTVREWHDNHGMNEHQWINPDSITWPQETEQTENWDTLEEKEWQDYHRLPEKIRHEPSVNVALGGNGVGGSTCVGGSVSSSNAVSIGPLVGNASSGSNPVGLLGTGSGGGRRWNNWRNRRGNHHNNGGPGPGGNTNIDYRRHNNHNQPLIEGYPNRGDLNFTNRRLIHQKPEIHNSISLINGIPHATGPRHQILNLQKPDTTPTAPPKTPLIDHPNISSQPTQNVPVVVTTPSTPNVIEQSDAKKDDGIEPDAEEQIPDDLSEISGDDADDILNRQEDETAQLSTEPVLFASTTTTTIHDASIISKCNQISNEKSNVNIAFQPSGEGNDVFNFSGQYFRPDYEPEQQDKTSDQKPIDETIQTPTQKPTNIVEEPKLLNSPKLEDTATNTGIATETPILPIQLVVKTDLHETTTKDVAEEMDLDFEEISDGELEEEARIRGLGDALGVDWASLVEESKAIAKEKSTANNCKTTAKQRWQPHRILLDVGISLKMGGNEFATKILSDAYAKLEEEKCNETTAATATEVKIKIEPKDNDYDNGDYLNNVNNDADHIEQKNTNVNLKKMIKIESDRDDFSYHPIACVQVAQRTNAEFRKNLIFNATGPYSRALCAQRDLKMRRELLGCRIMVNKTNKQNTMETKELKKPTNNHSKKAWELFQKALGKVH